MYSEVQRVRPCTGAGGQTLQMVTCGATVVVYRRRGPYMYTRIILYSFDRFRDESGSYKTRPGLLLQCN